MSQHLNEIWRNNPAYIRRFYDNLSTNEKLCQEVSYILTTEIAKSGVEIAQISSRAKSLESFCEKISRKQYKDPFNDITDFAGVRVVYLYSTSRPEIEKIIEDHFVVTEKIDKTTVDEDKFGYGALHYLVKIRNDHAGARYNELRNKTCEIQVRTILQDAWALVAHHLSYKQESDVPKGLRRKLNALSGLFETADDQFENIRNTRKKYQEELKPFLSEGNIKNDEEANIDSLDAYLREKFPDRLQELEYLPSLLDELKAFGYNSLKDIDSMVSSALPAVLADENNNPPEDENNNRTNYASAGIVRVALGYMCPAYLEKHAQSRIDETKEFKHLVIK